MKKNNVKKSSKKTSSPNFSKQRKTKNQAHKESVIAILVTLTFIICIGVICYNDYLYGDTSKPENSINYEETLISDAKCNYYLPPENEVKKVTFDPYGMENGIYSIYINNESTPYLYQGGTLWQENKDLEELHEQTIFKKFTKREENIIQSARDLVCKYINDSNVLINKEYLINRIQNVPFYMYTDTTHPELLSVFDAPAVHMGIGIYCNKNFSEFFCEYMIVHELLHHLRYLTNGENIENEKYFATLFDEAITDIITYTINPKMFKDPNYASGYIDLYYVTYGYLSVFGEDALEAYFYGYDNFFQKNGGTTFETEHDAFVIVLDSYSQNYNSPMVCDGFFKTWTAQ